MGRRSSSLMHFGRPRTYLASSLGLRLPGSLARVGALGERAVLATSAPAVSLQSELHSSMGIPLRTEDSTLRFLPECVGPGAIELRDLWGRGYGT